VRFLCAEESFEPEEGVDIITDSMAEYKATRMIQGLCEGSKELGNNFPLNMLMHSLNAVSFTKGCYIGQELTQRTYYNGTIRRIALPFALMTDAKDKTTMHITDFDPHNDLDRNFDGMDLKGELIMDQKGKKLGKVLAS